MLVGLNSSLGMKRSSTCTDLLAMCGGALDDSDPLGQSKKRVSSMVFGWDHYRSNEDTISVEDDEYQSWRNKKRKRSTNRTQRRLFQKSLLSEINYSDVDSVSQSPCLSSIGTPPTEFELPKLSASQSECSLLSATSRTISEDSAKGKSVVIHIREITHELASTMV